jgi:pimeloyl-ACP methyl ester carboxylesterase
VRLSHTRRGSPPLETLTFEQFCFDAEALREHLGFERVAVPGYSYGGFIALEYALRYPERLSHLILLDTSPGGDYWEEVKTNARRKGATEEQLEALEARPQSSKVQRLAAERRRVRRVMSSSCSQPSPVKE